MILRESESVKKVHVYLTIKEVTIICDNDKIFLK